MPSHIAILPSDLPEHAGSIPASRARVAQAYGRLPPAALMLLAVIAVVDTNCDPDNIDCVIPGNDDALRAIKLFVSKIADAVIEGAAALKDKASEGEAKAEGLLPGLASEKADLKGNGSDESSAVVEGLKAAGDSGTSEGRAGAKGRASRPDLGSQPVA